jgi:lipoprotein-anchoring transpeptidase ErfK/SrfK
MIQTPLIARRTFLIGAGALTLAGCVSTRQPAPAPVVVIPPPPPPTPSMYLAMPNERFPIPEVDVSQVDQKWWRRDVDYPTDEKVGTVIVDTPSRYLYHVGSNGRATRYGIGVGREGFEWAGRGHIAYKREWPRWTPPNEMVARRPDLEPYSIDNGGMGPGLDNPLGARALYIHEGNRDTIYRIHGNQEFSSIGRAVSSGCVRMINQDVIHLADNVRDGSTIVVIPDPAMGHLMVG